jgi:hypothetical protein
MTVRFLNRNKNNAVQELIVQELIVQHMSHFDGAAALGLPRGSTRERASLLQSHSLATRSARWSSCYLRAAALVGQSARIQGPKGWRVATVVDACIQPGSGEMQLRLMPSTGTAEYFRVDDMDAHLRPALLRQLRATESDASAPAAAASSGSVAPDEEPALFTNSAAHLLSTRAVWVLRPDVEGAWSPGLQRVASRACEEAERQASGLAVVDIAASPIEMALAALGMPHPEQAPMAEGGGPAGLAAATAHAHLGQLFPLSSPPHGCFSSGNLTGAQNGLRAASLSLAVQAESARTAAAIDWAKGCSALLLQHLGGAGAAGEGRAGTAASKPAPLVSTTAGGRPASFLEEPLVADLRGCLAAPVAVDPITSPVIISEMLKRDKERLRGKAVQGSAHDAPPSGSDEALAKALQPGDYVGRWLGWWEFGVPLNGSGDTASTACEYACRAAAAIELAADSASRSRDEATVRAGGAARKSRPRSTTVASVSIDASDTSDVFPGGIPAFDASLPPAFFVAPQLASALQRALEAHSISPGTSACAHAVLAASDAEWNALCASVAGAQQTQQSAEAPSDATAADGGEGGTKAKRSLKEQELALLAIDSNFGKDSAPSLPSAEHPALQGWAGTPGPTGRWVVAWVARYCTTSRHHLLVFDWPSAVGCAVPADAAAAVGITRALRYVEWVDLAAPSPDRMPVLLPRAGPLSQLRSPDSLLGAIDRDVEAALSLVPAMPWAAAAAQPRCCWCLHGASADAPLILCSRAPVQGSGAPLCGKFSHLGCMGSGQGTADGASLKQVETDARSTLADARVAAPLPGFAHVYRLPLHAAAIRTAAGDGLSVAASELLAWHCDNCVTCDMCGSRFPRGNDVECTLKSAVQKTLAASAGAAASKALAARDGELQPWRPADLDERGTEGLVGSWREFSYSPMPGDWLYSTRLRSLSGKPTWPEPAVASFGDRVREKGSVGVAPESAASLAATRAVCHPFQLGEQMGEVPYDYDGPLRFGRIGMPLSGAVPEAAVSLNLCGPCNARCEVKIFCPVCHGQFLHDSGHMLGCDGCSGWVHGRCAGLDPLVDLPAIEAKNHAEWGKAFYCSVCIRARMTYALLLLRQEDKAGFFHYPVTAELAPGYFNVISRPMDFHTIELRLTAGEYDTYGLAGCNAFRADCEQIVRNALVFNTPQDRVYRDAWRLLKAIKSIMAGHLPITSDAAFRDEFASLRAMLKGDARLASAAAASEDVEGDDYGWSGHGAGRGDSSGAGGPRRLKGEGGSDAAEGDSAVDAMASLLPARNAMLYGPSGKGERMQPAPASLLPAEWRELGSAAPVLVKSVLCLAEVRMDAEEAALVSSVDACAVCGTTGHPELMLFCVDCGEAHHLFCSAAGLFVRWMGEAAAADGATPAGVREVEISAMSTLATPAQRRAMCSPTVVASVRRAVVANNWRCGNCKVCDVCGECCGEHENRLLVCDACDAGQHTFCCDPPLAVVPNETWFCARCIDCKECGKGGPGAPPLPSSVWSHELHRCLGCCGGPPAPEVPQSHCSICSMETATDMTDTRMIACEVCERWCHTRCDPAVFPDAAVLEVVQNWDEESRYTCALCRGTDDVHLMGSDLAQHAVRVAAKLRLMAVEARTAIVGHAAAQLGGEPPRILPSVPAAADGTSSALALRSSRAAQTRLCTRAGELLTAIPASASVWESIPLPLPWVLEEATDSSSRFGPLPPGLAELVDRPIPPPASLRAYLASLALAGETVMTTEALNAATWVAAGSKKRPRVEEVQAALPVAAAGLSKSKVPAAKKAKSAAAEVVTLERLPQERIVPHTLPFAAADPRICVFCGQCGDLESVGEGLFQGGVEGRLLPIPAVALAAASYGPRHPAWAHILCAYTASETSEASTMGAGAGITSVGTAIGRAAKTACSHCGSRGAGLQCHATGCNRSYHLRCALVSGCAFPNATDYDKKLLCTVHAGGPAAPRVVKTKPGRKRAADAIAGGVSSGSDVAAAGSAEEQHTFPSIAEVLAAFEARPAVFFLLQAFNDATYMTILPASKNRAGFTKGTAGLQLAVNAVDFSDSALPEAARGPPPPEALHGGEDGMDAVGTSKRALAVARELRTSAMAPLVCPAPATPLAATPRDSDMDALLSLHPGMAAIPPSSTGRASFPVLRVGGATVLRWGRLITRRPGYATPSLIIPAGFRARRIWWGPAVEMRAGADGGPAFPALLPALARMSYTCDVVDMFGPVLDTERAREVAGLGKGNSTEALRSAAQAGASLFVITADDFPALRVASHSADEALFLLRQRIVSLLGRQVAGQLLTREEWAAAAQANLAASGSPQEVCDQAVESELALSRPGSRLRWRRTVSGKDGELPMSLYAEAPTERDAAGKPTRAMLQRVRVEPGLPGGADSFGLQGPVWMGFGLPAVQKALESLPEAALLQITPVGTAAWWPRFEYRCGQPAPGVLAEARVTRQADERRAEKETARFASRTAPYDRADRNTARHHNTSLLAARVSTLNHPALFDPDRAAVGDLPVSIAGLQAVVSQSGDGEVREGLEDGDEPRNAVPMLWNEPGGPGERIEGSFEAASLANHDEEGYIVSSSVDLPEEAAVPEAADSVLNSGGNEKERDLTASYRAMRGRPMSAAIVVRRSPIHGWGLVLKADQTAHSVLVEYVGEMVRQPVADRREIEYEELARMSGRFTHMAGEGGAQAAGGGYDMASFFQVPVDGRRSDGSGSCYLFRLDDEWIVDATVKGGPARFINHCCEPNCYSRVIVVDGVKRIVICAIRDLLRGEELVYNYKFGGCPYSPPLLHSLSPSLPHAALETDPALKVPCYCGKPSCWGSMN